MERKAHEIRTRNKKLSSSLASRVSQGICYRSIEKLKEEHRKSPRNVLNLRCKFSDLIIFTRIECL